jgi:hypothetical protein
MSQLAWDAFDPSSLQGTMSTPGGPEEKWRAVVLAIAAVVLAAVAPLATSLGFGFVWDDRLQILENPFIAGDSSFLDLFTHDVWAFAPGPRIAHSYYRPLPLALWKALFLASGGQPLAFHLVSVLLHAGVSVLLFLVARRLVRARTALLGACIFAAHPLRVESVAWISGVMDLMAAASLLGALLAFMRFWASRRAWALGLGGVLFAAALLSKEVAFALVPFLLIVLAVQAARDRRSWLIAGVVLGTCSAVTLWRVLLLPRLLPGTGPQALTAPVLLVRYLALLAVPWPHEHHATMAQVDGLLDPRLVVSILAAAGGAVVLRVASVRLRSVAGALALWAVVTLIPACIGPAPKTPFAERYTYVPGLAAALLVAVAAAWVAERARWSPGWRLTSGAGLVTALGVITLSRLGAWRDEETLFRAMLSENPSDAYPHFCLGVHFVKRDRFSAARPFFESAARLDPSYSEAWNALGNFAVLEGRYAEAVSLYRRAVGTGPDYLDARYGLAHALALTGSCDEARVIAADLRSGQDDAHRLLQRQVLAIGDPLGRAVLRNCR